MSKFIPKTKAELKLMREGGKILQAAQAEIKKHIKPGISLLELDKIAEDFIRLKGGTPSFKGFHGFPGSLCTMRNEVVVHGIPDEQLLEYGDLLSIDCGVTYKGFVADAAFTVIVGGDEADPGRAKFSQTVKKALEAGCAQAVAGNTLGDIGHVVQKTVEGAGYSIIREFTGHGVGKAMHEDPYVFNYGAPRAGDKLVEGMTICIEPIVSRGKPQYKTLPDGWTEVTQDGSDACQWEHYGVVTKAGLEIFA